MDKLFENFLQAAAFSVLGIVLFAIAFFIMSRLLPHFMHKEIEEEKNSAVAILMGSVIIGIAIIVAAAIH